MPVGTRELGTRRRLRGRSALGRKGFSTCWQKTGASTDRPADDDRRAHRAGRDRSPDALRPRRQTARRHVEGGDGHPLRPISQHQEQPSRPWRPAPSSAPRPPRSSRMTSGTNSSRESRSWPPGHAGYQAMAERTVPLVALVREQRLPGGRTRDGARGGPGGPEPVRVRTAGRPRTRDRPPLAQGEVRRCRRVRADTSQPSLRCRPRATSTSPTRRKGPPPLLGHDRAAAEWTPWRHPSAARGRQRPQDAPRPRLCPTAPPYG